MSHRRRKILNIGGTRFRIFVGGGGGGGGAGGEGENDNVAKLRIELKSILLEIPSNKIKGTYI